LSVRVPFTPFLSNFHLRRSKTGEIGSRRCEHGMSRVRVLIAPRSDSSLEQHRQGEHQMSDPIVCTPKSLPREKWVDAARKAVEINPANQPPTAIVARGLGGPGSQLERIAVMIAKRWHTAGVRLTVGFLDNPPADLRARIIAHMNAWAKTANVQFTETKTNPQVRIARASSPPEVAGYWSYLGTDILSIPANEPTMNLEAFTMNTLDSEFHRVVRHETGHTLGFPHEHMRRELVDGIDPARAIAFFGATQGWTPEEVRRRFSPPWRTRPCSERPMPTRIPSCVIRFPAISPRTTNPLLEASTLTPSTTRSRNRSIRRTCSSELLKKGHIIPRRKRRGNCSWQSAVTASSPSLPR
jgi:hypothetical protein